MSDLAEAQIPIQSTMSLPGRVPPALGLTIVLTAVICGLATCLILTGVTPIKPTPELNRLLVILNGVLILALLVMISWQVVILWRARRKRIAGARLHGRLVAMFAAVAALPALTVALSATVMLNLGFDAFLDRTKNIVGGTEAVASAYLLEHEFRMNELSKAVAQTLEQIYAAPGNEAFLSAARQDVLQRTLNTGVAAAYLYNADKKEVESSETDGAASNIKFEPAPAELLKNVNANTARVDRPWRNNIMRAIAKLPGRNMYLYAYQILDPELLEQLDAALKNKQDYDALESQRWYIQVTFASMYLGVSLIFLLAAVWLGLSVADKLVEPIVKLVDAARSVSRGDLDTKVKVRKDQGDIATLGRTFNQMTNQLRQQRNELVGANVLIDERRRFMEAVLAGVTAGVIGVDEDGNITLVNRSALKLLARRSRDLQTQKLVKVLPEFGDLLKEAMKKASGTAEGQVEMKVGDEERRFTIRVTNERSHDEAHGYVVTFDDMTDLVTAQRNSAWADIARRIAHEIKNPLTPIQLSAERLRRKYGKEITSDPTVFEQCTSTIIRQVGDIGRMVDEFSSFARMPKAVLENNNLNAVVKEALVLQKASTDDVQFDLHLPENKIEFAFDRRLITQAVTNLVKNAREAIEPLTNKDQDHRGHIAVFLDQKDDEVTVSVADNGIGLPKQNRQRLTEPYMTTREKGTGLGLAIVKRIMEEHEGEIRLTDAPENHADGAGAQVSLVFDLKKLKGEPDVQNEPIEKDAPQKSAMGEALASQMAAVGDAKE
ncbi:MAG: ATP-binding protein [Hyphomicrobiales bacterium]